MRFGVPGDRGLALIGDPDTLDIGRLVGRGGLQLAHRVLHARTRCGQQLVWIMLYPAYSISFFEPPLVPFFPLCLN